VASQPEEILVGPFRFWFILFALIGCSLQFSQG